MYSAKFIIRNRRKCHAIELVFYKAVELVVFVGFGAEWAGAFGEFAKVIIGVKSNMTFGISVLDGTAKEVVF